MVEMAARMLQAAAAFPVRRGSVEPGRAGVLVCERNPQLATIIVYRGRRADASARLKARYGLALPDGPRRLVNGGSTVTGVGPRTWLFQRETGPPLETELSEVLGDAAAVTDQSDGYATIRLTGPCSAGVLEKGISIDLHDRVFLPGFAAATSCAHLGIILWRLEDANGHPVYEIAVFRSLARSLWHFIEQNAAEFGLAAMAEC
jgi:heterotetrameric sarcosine oxidase gamma subunit